MLNSHDLERIEYFFRHYKDLEYKKVKIGEFKEKIEAIKIYNDSIQRFNEKNNQTQTNKITNYYK